MHARAQKTYNSLQGREVKLWLLTSQDQYFFFGAGDRPCALAESGIQPAVQPHAKIIYNFILSCREQQIFSLYLCLKFLVAELISHLWQQEFGNHSRSRCWWTSVSVNVGACVCVCVPVCVCVCACVGTLTTDKWVWQQEKKRRIRKCECVYTCVNRDLCIFSYPIWSPKLSALVSGSHCISFVLTYDYYANNPRYCCKSKKKSTLVCLVRCCRFKLSCHQ